jgi:hypothetical protein
MKKLMVLFALTAVSPVTKAPAQEPVAPEPTPARATQTPRTDNADFYRQRLRRYDEGAMAVRRKAQYRAQQRMLRISALKWFGMSNSRPTAAALPWGGTYSPRWVSNSRRPQAWVGGGTQNTVVVVPRAER